MFGGDVHARAYADLQRTGISPQLGRVGLDHWARELAPIKFELTAIATRTKESAERAAENFRNWTKQAPRAYAGESLNAQHMDQVHLYALPRGGSC